MEAIHNDPRSPSSFGRIVLHLVRREPENIERTNQVDLDGFGKHAQCHRPLLPRIRPAVPMPAQLTADGAVS